MYTVNRNTRETKVALSVSHPAPSGSSHVSVGCGFLAHMLELMAHRAKLCLEVEASGDAHVDAHHITEDVGIVFGMALKKMLSSTESPRSRYGWCLLPMDGSLARVALDLSGRGGLYWEGNFPTHRCGDFDLELVPEFFRAFCRESCSTLHIALITADNSHHAAEAVFKGFGIALDMGLAPSQIDPSTKGEWI